MSVITKDEINGLMDTIRNLYLADDIPWVIGYSGGKDSTAALQIVWMAIRELPPDERHKIIHIINNDTLVESPVISKWARNSLLRMDIEAEKENLPFVTHTLIPDYDNTFWVNLLGRGYPFPRKKFRWCTDRMKIQPVNKFVKDKIAEHGEIIMVLGTRKAESAARAKRMAYYEKKRVRELLSPNPTMVNELVFAPLSEWTDDDVWIFLMQYPNPWGYSNDDLLTLYKGATADNECPMMVEKDLPSCGRSRFGCWVCTMVEKDKSMEAMIANDDEKAWMAPLLEFRNEFGDEEQDRERRSFRKMGGFLQGSYGRLNHGPYKKEIREAWIRKLFQMQKEIQAIGPEEFQNLELITMPELREIRRIWVLDKHEFDDSLPRIYEEEFDRPFEDAEWISSEIFNKMEWDILSEVCSELYPDEELAFEMMYSLVDIENHSTDLNSRKGIADAIESTIRHTFYANEDDAANYYNEKATRKKDLGGKFDPKYFESFEPEGDEFPDTNTPEETSDFSFGIGEQTWS